VNVVPCQVVIIFVSSVEIVLRNVVGTRAGQLSATCKPSIES
jgi:hypothetical protein